MPEILETAIDTYISEIAAQFTSGQAREHGYRPALERLMRSFEDVGATNDPKRSAHGNPDMIFYKKSNHDVILGYAEAKDITVNLNKITKSEQLRRYAGYEKLFLTNYLDFRFYQNGEEYESISLGKLSGQRVDFDRTQLMRLAHELQAFLELSPESIKSGKRLALIMGGKARRIRDNVAAYLDHAENEKNQELEKIYKMMKELLVHDLTTEKFADMYAQTLVYGLFVARYNDKTPDNFNRREARDLVPASNPFLREFFDHIVGPRFDARLGHIVDELCEVLSVSDVHTIVQKHLRLFEAENNKDPIIHFYEDFLKEYDPAERKKMGAYYTPVPVVRFIVRQVDEILKREFSLPKGLADTSKIIREVDHGQTLQIRNPKTGRLEKTSVERKEFHKVQILDPAVGTATFLNETIKYIHKSFEGQAGRWPGYVREDLLPRLYGFELMMAPYVIAHLKLGMTLQETGVDAFEQRLGVYLTNTLEEGDNKQVDLFRSFGLAQVVSEESQAASEIKHNRPIMIVMGNPPYSGVSSNETKYANSLIDKYKVEPGGKQKLQERKHWLNDDYVKFIAFAEDMIAKNGSGIVSMITNNGYLDNPTSRGMRWHLAKTFDKIYVLDLHGNAKKKEVAPDGGKDENVFDIMQGVSIILAVKTSDAALPADIFHNEIYGKRNDKFTLLAEEMEWKPVQLDNDFYKFKPTNKNANEYEQYISLPDIFLKSSTGIQTSRDDLITDFDQDTLVKRINRISTSELSDEDLRRELNLKQNSNKYPAGDTRDWKFSDVRKSLQETPINNSSYVDYYFRPFDLRKIAYDTRLVSWARFDVARHMLRDNYSLIFARSNKSDTVDHFQITDKISDVKSGERTTGSMFAPLYLYHDDGTRTSNLNTNVLKQLTTNISSGYQPKDILDYIYAVLYSPNYRAKYKEFLKIDFPRVPAPASDAEFKRLAGFGKQLRELHLMKSPRIDDRNTTYSVADSNEVEKVSYTGDKVYINDTQYFGNVPATAWNFYIGGYQPAQKWLKDRRGRELTNQDIDHYQNIIKILVETDKIMKQIDEVSHP